MLLNKAKLNKYKSLSGAEKSELEEKLKRSCSNQSDIELLHCIVAGIIKLEDIQGSLEEDRYGDLEKEYEEYKNSVLAEEKQRLREIETTQHPKDKRQKAEAFLNDYPTGNCVSEVKRILQEIEDAHWARVSAASGSIVQLEKELDAYLAEYPEGTYTKEAEQMKEDLPWTKVKLNPTLDALDEYERSYPGKHTDEIQKLREEIQDDLDFRNVNNDKVKAQEYLNKHPYGKHVAEALEIINRPDSDKDIFIKNLKSNRNYYPARVIQRELGNRIIVESDLREIFTPKQIKAIIQYQEPTKLPDVSAQSELKKGYTEIYFWGIKGSGKTCAIGSILSGADKYGIFRPLACAGSDYMDMLSNLFTNGICILPDSTTTKSIPEMTLEMVDSDDRPHKMLFLDCAGEVFHAMYKQRHRLRITAEEQESLNKVQQYLQNDYNNKIHFFVIEYGENTPTKEVDPSSLPGVRQKNILQELASYLKEQKIFRESTVGVYCLVTKSDMIDCEVEERPKKACEYVINNYPSFWNTIVDECKNANISECKTIAFSIGYVFAQDLCQLTPNKPSGVINNSSLDAKTLWNPSGHNGDPEKVINKLLAKTEAEKDGLIGFFRQ